MKGPSPKKVLRKFFGIIMTGVLTWVNWDPLWWAMGGGSWKFSLAKQIKFSLAKSQIYGRFDFFKAPVQILKQAAPVKIDVLRGVDVVYHQRLVQPRLENCKIFWPFLGFESSELL